MDKSQTNQTDPGISLQCWVSEYLPVGLQQPDLSHSMEFFHFLQPAVLVAGFLLLLQLALCHYL